MRLSNLSRLGRFPRFLAVGVLNTLFGLLVYSVCILLKCPTWVALIGGNIAGIAFNFITTGGLVFADLSRKRIPRFVFAYIGLYFLNLGLSHEITPMVGGPILSQTLLAPPLACISFLLMSRFVFTEKPEHRP
ncbi:MULTISPECIES: GtrA family protein [unclassified Cupriavidus]|uniref:GtrA family protein n=1 Tax=unclassified Cupriavidus TaxID=2640874 RepID=UPI0013644FE7|nr:GtrA family protein [Cupriavidus sp. SK-3]